MGKIPKKNQSKLELEWQREKSKSYFRIDASSNGVNEISPQTLHLSEAYPRHDIFPDDDGSDEFLGVLLCRHAEKPAGWCERETNEIGKFLSQENGENRSCTSTQRVTDQCQAELVSSSIGILRNDIQSE